MKHVVDAFSCIVTMETLLQAFAGFSTVLSGSF